LKRGFEFKKCGNCKSVYYCSRECQRADWAKHKESCATLAATASKTKRSEEAIERTFSLRWIYQHLLDIVTLAMEANLGMGDVVFEVNFLGLDPKPTYHRKSFIILEIILEIQWFCCSVVS
jgi:hypothetical protein